jgi:hypothetical protein
MIEGPNPGYFDEYEKIPHDLIKLMRRGCDEEDLISDWLDLPATQRRELLECLRTFLSKPPSEFQIYSLIMYRDIDSTEAELLAFIEDICRRLELSLQADP